MEKTKRHEYFKLTFLLMGLAIAFIGLFVTCYYCYNYRIDDVQEIETMHYESMNYDLPYNSDGNIFTRSNNIIYHGIVQNDGNMRQFYDDYDVLFFEPNNWSFANEVNYNKAVFRQDILDDAYRFGMSDWSSIKFFGLCTLLFEFDGNYRDFFIIDDTAQWYFFYFSDTLLTGDITNTCLTYGYCYRPFDEYDMGDYNFSIDNGIAFNGYFVNSTRYLYLTLPICIDYDGNSYSIEDTVTYQEPYIYLCSHFDNQTIEDSEYYYQWIRDCEWTDWYNLPLLPFKNLYINYEDLLADYDNAYQNGYDNGYLAGNNYGYSNGFQAGIDDGYEQGYAHGVSSALTETDMTSTYRYFVNSYVYEVDSSEFADFDYYMHNLGTYERFEFNGVTTDEYLDLFSSYQGIYSFDYNTSKQYIIIPTIPIRANTIIEFIFPSTPNNLGFKLLFDDGSIETVARNQFGESLSRSWSKSIVAINFQLNFPIYSDVKIKINTNSLDYDKGYAAGNKDGYSTGYDNGLNNGIAYGYGEGFKEGANNQNALANMVLTVAGVPFETFYQIWHFNVLGFNFADFIFGILSLLIVIYIIKKII